MKRSSTSVLRGVLRSVLAALALVWAVGSVSADVVVLDADRDTTIYEESADVANGAGSYLFAGTTNNGFYRRALIRFDVAAAVPAGSVIDSVTLTLNMSRTLVGSQPVSLHVALQDWGEGASDAVGSEGAGAPAQPGDATWADTFYDDAIWVTPGGHFVAAPSATSDVGGISAYAWSSIQMAQDVQLWLEDPAFNYGWFVIGVEGPDRPVTSKRFDSRDNVSSGAQPRLVVEFTPPAIDGACCTGTECRSTSRAECASIPGASFLGEATSCAADPCLLPQGACCADDGSCAELPEAFCAATFLGQGTSCEPDACPEPEGACCLPAGTCRESGADQCIADGGVFRGFASTCEPELCPVVLEPFVDELTIPPVAQPLSGTIGGEASYEIRMLETTVKMHRDLPPTRVWAYDGVFPGPTIEASSNERVNVRWVNDLRNENGELRTLHYLPVDLCPHGPDHEGPNPRTVVHLHGAHVEAAFDGYPEDTILPGQYDDYSYGNGQLPATLWYHDHALGITRLNAYLGLEGFYLIRDDFERSLALPTGEFEVPLLIADRSFNADGTLRYPAEWQEHFVGDTIVVNGKVWPFMDVRQGKYRFRVLNASNSRTLKLTLSNGMPFTVIGSDGGLLEAPVTVDSLTLGPAERSDLVIDFAGLEPGTEMLMLNQAPAPFPGQPGVGVVPDVMKFVVGDRVGYTAPLPSALRPIERLSEVDSVIQRDFVLRRTPEACTGAAWRINGLSWDDITEFPELGTTEIWRFVNPTGLMHPMHMHLVMFQVLDRQPFDLVDFQIVPTGPRVAPLPQEAGWKDTVQVYPHQLVRVIARFEDFTGKFAYHCHILEHEDHDMMRQFQTIQCGNSVLEPTEQCDDGNLDSIDGCSAACEIEGFLILTGTARGGAVSLRVDGVSIAVNTTLGQSADEVLAAIANAINGNSQLSARGVVARLPDFGLVTGQITDLTIADPGLSTREFMRLGVGELRIGGAGMPDFDLVQGDLAVLRGGGGDFAAATETCVEAGKDGTLDVKSIIPASGQGYWFLARGQGGASTGSYDSGAPSQIGPRDDGIRASGRACR